jgi:hypothetical protein
MQFSRGHDVEADLDAVPFSFVALTFKNGGRSDLNARLV